MNTTSDQKFVVHPRDIPLSVSQVVAGRHPTHSTECLGLLFYSQVAYKPEEQLEIAITLENMNFIGQAKVVDCHRMLGEFATRVIFFKSCQVFNVKMALQICQINSYIKKGQTPAERDQLANEWINRNAAHF